MREQANAECESNAPDNQKQSKHESFHCRHKSNRVLRHFQLSAGKSTPDSAATSRSSVVNGTPTAQNGEASEYPDTTSPLVAVKLLGVRGQKIPKKRSVL
jgi:hypothetical protein